MDNSGLDISLDAFLAEILYKPEPASTAAFTAQILREYDPDEPRDERGRWTTGGGTASGASGAVKTSPESSTVSAPAKVTTIDNPKYSDVSWLLKGAGKPPSVIEKEYGALDPSIIPRGRDPKGQDKNTLGAKQAETIVSTGIPDGFLVGSEGAGTCIITIISTPLAQRPGTYDVAASHFESQDDPDSVWDKLDAFPKGTRVAITGGNGSRSSNTQMLVTVASLAYRKGVTIDGYFYGNGLWVDNRGRYYAFRTNVGKKN